MLVRADLTRHSMSPRSSRACLYKLLSSLIYNIQLEFESFKHVSKFHIPYDTRHLLFSIYTFHLPCCNLCLIKRSQGQRIPKIKGDNLVQPPNPIEFYGVNISDLII